MSKSQVIGDLPGSAQASPQRLAYERARRWVLAGAWYLANAGGLAALYLTRILG